MLPAQVLGGEQSCASVADVQLVRHAPSAHVKVPHDWLGGVTHAPCPSHMEAGVSIVAVAQTAERQLMPASWLAHTPRTQSPVMPQVEDGVT